ncbi:hypothetical protein [Rufibacter aurantiacus]|uniref:hypothetical protein n=1 Tax=Rufibacter aurantiacus TaxID=2817374 RepID=UPI001B317BC5|nr:hypothetical protein [Rufibacter aurantiacus]
MNLAEAIKIALHHRQCPMTATQLAYFLRANKVVTNEDGEDLVAQIEEETMGSPAYFSVFKGFVYLSSWSRTERAVIDYVFSVMGRVSSALQQMSLHQSLALSLLLYKRLSDIERSQQVAGPVVPDLLKFNNIVQATAPQELPGRLVEVMSYIESTVPRFTEMFLTAREELTMIRRPEVAETFQAAMLLLAGLKLDEEQVPTPLFQAIFSRLFWNNVQSTCNEIGENGG